MHERIKELAEQATDKEHGYSFFDREKFAELIVRECADIATINSHQQYSAGHYVLKHFGLGGV